MVSHLQVAASHRQAAHQHQPTLLPKTLQKALRGKVKVTAAQLEAMRQQLQPAAPRQMARQLALRRAHWLLPRWEAVSNQVERQQAAWRSQA
jgi:hypothetical protein